MAGEPRYRRDLFTGTAAFYDRFRLPYPAVLLDGLRAEVPLGSSARVLDLACGTGQIACPLAGAVAEVWAVDQQPDLIEFARRKGERLGLTNVAWIVGTAEDVVLEGTFDLVAIGNAFHRLDRDRVAGRLAPHLSERGCVALLWGGPPWMGERPWQRALHDTLERWRDIAGGGDRVPEGWEQAMERDPHEQVLRRAGLSDVRTFESSIGERWSIESIIGFVYSTSFLNRSVLDDRVETFENDLRRELVGRCPDGVFDQNVTFACQLARRAP